MRLIAALACLLAPGELTTDQRIAQIERRLKQSPNDREARNELAGAFLQKMRETADGSYLERAARLVGGVIKADAGHRPARRRQLEIEMHRHHFREVLSLAATLLRTDPTDWTALGLSGDAHMELGEIDAAEVAYQKMADARPGFASYNRIAWFRFITGDADGAIELLRKATGIGAPPENLAWTYVELGDILLKTGQAGGAAQAFGAASNAFPGYPAALAGQARLEVAADRIPEAIALLTRAQAKAPYPEYAGMLAALYRKSGNAVMARRQLGMLDVADRLEQAAGESANRNLALALASLGHRPARALELARAELAVRGDVYTYDAVAWALLTNGQADEAATFIGKALALGTPEPRFHQHAARIYSALGRAADAARHQAKAAALNPRYDLLAGAP